MGGRGGSGNFPVIRLDITGMGMNGEPPSPLITAGLMELRGNEADAESTLQNIDKVRFNHLKHEQLFVVDNDGFVIQGYDGDEHSVAFEVSSAKKWAGLTVTHRHPSEFGGTFSIPDIINMAKYNWKTHEASANEGRYRIQATKKANGNGLITAITKGLPEVQKEMQAVAKKCTYRKYPDIDTYRLESRKAQLQVVEKWYQETLPKHGYEYEFKARKED